RGLLDDGGAAPAAPARREPAADAEEATAGPAGAAADGLPPASADASGPADDAPADDAPAQDARVEDTPAGDAPAARPVTAPPGDSLREEAEAALRELVGRDDARLRDDQWTAIEALAAFRRRALVVQRTGWGKSAVYLDRKSVGEGARGE